MAMISQLFAGVTDYFRGYLAKNYDDVLNNATKRFDPARLSKERAQTVQAFQQQLASNRNFTSSQVDALTARHNARHALGDFLENTFGLVGMAGSMVGGTIGYGTKKLLTNSATKAAAGATAATGAVAGTGAALVKGVGMATNAGLPVMPGLGGMVQTALPSIQLTAGHVARTSWQATRKAAPVVAKGTGEYAAMVGRDIGKGAKFVWDNRDSRGMQLAAAGGFLALSGSAYQGGQYEQKYQHKMQQVASNLTLSDDGGGTFLRPIASPQVANNGATGDLVFALHSLRNGG